MRADKQTRNYHNILHFTTGKGKDDERKQGAHLSHLSLQPAGASNLRVTFPVVGCHCLWQVPNYTAWWQRHVREYTSTLFRQ